MPHRAEAQPPASPAKPAAVCEASTWLFRGPAGEPPTIATALAITGDVAFLGNDSNFGTQVAQEERGQVLGRDVEVLHEDAGCGDAATGQTAAEAIVANTAILGVIGTTCSRTAIPAMPVLEEAGLIMLSPSNTAPGLTNPEHEQWAGENYFRIAYNDKVQGAAVAQFVCDELAGPRLPPFTMAARMPSSCSRCSQTSSTRSAAARPSPQDAINVGDTTSVSC